MRLSSFATCSTRLLYVYELQSAMCTLHAFFYEYRKPGFCENITSCSCCIPPANQMIDHCFTLKENVKMRNLLSVDHFTCGTIFHTRKTMAANPMPWRFGYEHLSVIWLWSSPVFRLVVSAAWSFSEQCKLLSACVFHSNYHSSKWNFVVSYSGWHCV